MKVRILLPEPLPAHQLMNLDKTCQLFFGCKIDSKLREALANAKPGDRRYFENPEFLSICTVGEDQKWIGKITKGGLNAGDVEDIQRNVVSILRRIATGVRISPSSIKIFAVTSEPETTPEQRTSGDPYIVNY